MPVAGAEHTGGGVPGRQPLAGRHTSAEIETNISGNEQQGKWTVVALEAGADLCD